nr:hypothetical protein [Tanacetum cinerariifolium]
VLALEKTKTTKVLEITSLKRRVKKLEKKQRSRTHKLKRLYKVSVVGEVNAASIAITIKSIKKQKVEDDKEIAELKQLMEIIPDEEKVAVDAIPLAVKKPTRKDSQVPQPSGLIESVADEAVYNELESSSDKESLGESASKQGRRIDAIDVDEKITMVSVQYEVVSNDADKEMFDVDVLGGEEVFVVGKNKNVVKEVVDDAQVSTAATTVTISIKEITLAQALEALKTSKPKDKGKGTIIKEPVKPKKKDQIRLDEEAAKKLQAKFDEEERLAREKAKKEERANIALIEEWDDI